VRRDPPGGRRSRLARLTCLAIAIAAGCGGGAAAEGGDEDLFDAAPNRELQLDMVDIAFGVDQIAVRAGEITAITIENSGALVHDITLDAPGTRAGFRVLDGDPVSQDPPRRSSAHLTLRPGSTAELRLEIAEPGEYEYYCSVPGHRGGGMRGILTVG
jgi:uncharacterized cupredoxin-like copper-binding protein